MKSFLEILNASDGFVHLQPATVTDICRAEEVLGVMFAKEYKDYLSSCGAASVRGHEFTGICESKRLNVVAATERVRAMGIKSPLNAYVVEESDCEGITIWQNSSGEVLQSNPNAAAVKIAKSLAEYMDR